MARLSLCLLGGLGARLESGASLRLPSRKTQALLAYLAVRPGQPHSREKIAALLWGDTGDVQARNSLRHALVALRKVLPAKPPVLVVEGQTLAVSPEAVDVDVITFEQRLSEATAAALEAAASLYRGDFLDGFVVREAAFEDWLIVERERLRELALDGLARLLAHQDQAGLTERAIHTAVRLLALDPLQEPVHRALMRLDGRQGRRNAALRQYQVCVDVLRRELGAEPETETKQLYQELLQLRSSQSKTAETAPAPASGRRPARRRRAQAGRPAAEIPLVGTRGRARPTAGRARRRGRGTRAGRGRPR